MKSSIINSIGNKFLGKIAFLMILKFYEGRILKLDSPSFSLFVFSKRNEKGNIVFF